MYAYLECESTAILTNFTRVCISEITVLVIFSSPHFWSQFSLPLGPCPLFLLPLNLSLPVSSIQTPPVIRGCVLRRTSQPDSSHKESLNKERRFRGFVVTDTAKCPVCNRWLTITEVRSVWCIGHSGTVRGLRYQHNGSSKQSHPNQTKRASLASWLVTVV